MKKITLFIVCMMLIAAFAGIFPVKISVADPTNKSPVFGSPTPANSSTGGSLSFSWNIPINDPEGNLIVWTIQCSNGQTTSSAGFGLLGTGAFNGSAYLGLSGLSYSTTYKVWVNATDSAGSGLYTRKWFTFTTRRNGNNPPVLTRAPSPANDSSGRQLSFSWSIRINDLEANLFSWSIQCSNGQGNSSTDASNGTKSLPLSGLTYSTSYIVWVNATDPTPTGSGLSVNRWFTFTTKANDPPVCGTPSLVNNSLGNSLSFNWSILISDPDGNHMNWRINCSNGQSASMNNASSGMRSLSLSGLTSSTTYTMWVNATDPTPSGSGLWTRRWFTFRTQGSGGNTPPMFGTPLPRNGSSGSRLNLQWSIQITDPQGTVFSWSIECSNGQGSNGTDASDGLQILKLSGLAYATTYRVWVNATDPTGSKTYTRKWYTFTTQASIPLSIPTQTTWSPIISETGETRVGPSVADINNDGQMEIIRSGINGIVVYNGATGAIVWRNLTAMFDWHNPLEIIDLNKDGYLDIISSYKTGTRALSGNNGSQLWYNPNAPLYNKHAVAGDINGDGYPEVFVTTSGPNDDDGEGAGSPLGSITALTYEGKTIKQIPTYYPCYGGLSLGDTNHDGRYELYLGERNLGYHDNTVGKGVRAFWASNLTEIWNHPEMLSSSNCPTLVDTNKDGILDVVALAQTGGNGIGVFNSADGSVIHQSSISGLRCHSNPTVYDIDGDGNLEILVGGGADSWSKPLVWDLYTWSLETWLPFDCYEPPAIADINGDGRVEILVCTIKNISIFDDNYVWRGSIPLDCNRSGYGWLGMSMIIAQDIDNDDKLELVLNRNSGLYAYETNGVAPIPRALSQFSYYSQHRGRSPYYVPFSSEPVNTPPVFGTPSPANGSTVNTLSPTWSIRITDSDDNPFSWTIQCNNGQNSTGIGSDGGTKTLSLSGLAYLTTYKIWVNATDPTGSNLYTRKWFTFTPKNSGGGSGGGGSGGSSGSSENVKPLANASAGEPYQGFVNSPILFNGSRSYDPDGTITKWSWVFSDESNGTGRTVSHTFLKAGTYNVTLTVTDNDGAVDTDATTCVITQPNRPPTKPTITGPTNGFTNITYSYSGYSIDTDNDTLQYTFDWGDSTSQSSEFVPNGKSYSVNHTWTAPGQYTIVVTVTDNQTVSSSQVLITIVEQETVEPKTTPGFESIFLLCAIAVSLLILRRKRIV